jgi:predicted lipoprotein with Yx(FWY)xxD motif
MFDKRLLGGVFALALAAAACANDTGNPAGIAVSDVADTAPAPAPADQGGTAGDALAAALLGTSAVGEIVVGTDGRALYGFTNDIDAISTCQGTCADAWPPVIVEPGWTVGPGLDTGIFATTKRDDGKLQLVAGKWPLYYYAGDAAPGDINGQASGEVWYLVDPDGTLLTDAETPVADGAPAQGSASGLVSTGESSLGPVMVDAEGLTLYGFTNDIDGLPSCYDDCADAWPPVLVGSGELPAGLDSEVFSVIERTDGAFQLVAGVWPLYRFAGDAAPGDANGQSSGDVWFAVAPDASLLKDGGSTGETGNTSEDESSGYDY